MGNVEGMQDLNATWEAGEHGYEIGKESKNIRSRGIWTPRFQTLVVLKSYHRPKDRKVLLKKTACYF